MTSKLNRYMTLLLSTALFIPTINIFGHPPRTRAGSRLSQLSEGRQPLTPIEDLLNVNGKLKRESGFNGSLNARGWEMITDWSGEPRFVQRVSADGMSRSSAAMNVADDINWDNRFAQPGVSSTVSVSEVFALAVKGNDVYVGGFFNRAGGAPAEAIARWDGTNWSPLGSGLSNNGVVGEVRAIAVSGNDLYVGGRFTQAGGVDARNIAKWDGTTWSALGSGITPLCFGCSPVVTAIAISGNKVYVGGQFTAAGEVTASNIAVWDGAAWSALGNGVQGGGFGVPVSALAVSGGNLYAGGSFIVQAGKVFTSGIAKWDGAAWSGVGGGVQGRVFALAVSGGDLYVGGQFFRAGNVDVENIAKWNGATWSALGSGLNNSVSALTLIGTDLYAGGTFTAAGGVTARRIAKWNGTGWAALGDGVSDDPDAGFNTSVSDLAADGTNLYLGGDFRLAGGLVANGFAKWNGADWSILSNGMGSSVAALVINGNDVYVTGSFTSAGAIRANFIAKWDGTRWSALGSGLNAPAAALVFAGSNLYVCGSFSMAGGVSASGVARWDGANWFALGSGLSGCIELDCRRGARAIAAIGSDIYVGGFFTEAGGISVNAIARWDGASWSSLDSGMNGPVFALAASGNDLYVGGAFTTAGDVNARGIAKWDGARWSALGMGVSGFFSTVTSIALSQGNVYVGGEFTTAGVTPASGIARWDGANWFALGSGVSSSGFPAPVATIVVKGSDIYVGGAFDKAGGVSAKDIAKWDGTNWSALGSGVNIDGFTGAVTALGVIGNDLYVGGTFTIAGGKPSSHFTRWSIPSTFDLCLQDDGNGNALKIDQTTGDYLFTVCGNGIQFGGRGELTGRGIIITLQHFISDRRLLATYNRSANKGTASLQVFSPRRTFTITDRNTTNNSCACP